MTPPQQLPTCSYWFEMCCRPAIRSARIPPNGRSSERPAAPVALNRRAASKVQRSVTAVDWNLYCRPLGERRRLAAAGIGMQVAEIAMQDGGHLVDRRRGFGA